MCAWRCFILFTNSSSLRTVISEFPSGSYLSLFLAPLIVFLLSPPGAFPDILSDWLVAEYVALGEDVKVREGVGL